MSMGKKHLNESERKHLHELYTRLGKSQVEISKKFNISQSAVSQILKQINACRIDVKFHPRSQEAFKLDQIKKSVGRNVEDKIQKHREFRDHALALQQEEAYLSAGKSKREDTDYRLGQIDSQLSRHAHNFTLRKFNKLLIALGYYFTRGHRRRLLHKLEYRPVPPYHDASGKLIRDGWEKPASRV